MRLSYGKIARAFWISLEQDKVLRKKCMRLVCKNILQEVKKDPNGRYHG